MTELATRPARTDTAPTSYTIAQCCQALRAVSAQTHSGNQFCRFGDDAPDKVCCCGSGLDSMPRSRTAAVPTNMPERDYIPGLDIPDPCPELQGLSIASLWEAANADHGRQADSKQSHLSATEATVSLAATSHLADTLIELHHRASGHLADFPEVRTYTMP
jgi:hypothetical protein